MEKANLQEMGRGKLTKFVVENGLEPFKANQIFKWIYRENVTDFGLMTDISIKHRSFLESIAVIENISLITLRE